MAPRPSAAAPCHAPRPSLVLLSGHPGAGKTTLTRRLADALWLPLVSRDALKHGLAETRCAWDEAGIDAATRASIGVFYGLAEFLLRAGVRA